MSPVLAAMLGGSAVAVGTYSYQKLRPRRNGKAAATLAEFRGLAGDLRDVAASGVEDLTAQTTLPVYARPRANKATDSLW